MNFFMQFATLDQVSPVVIEKAASLNLQIGFLAPASKNDWNESCALAGNTFPIKDALKANGARWNGSARAWTFDSFAALEAALTSIN